VSKRKRDAIAEWIERQEHMYVPGYWSKNWARFYPPFKISRKLMCFRIAWSVPVLLALDTALVLALIALVTEGNLGLILFIVTGVVFSGILSAVIVHDVVTLHKLSRNNKQD
jgi:hypothetical protein